MKKLLPVLFILIVAMPAAAHWVPADGHKMHEPQLPDLIGWDVNATSSYPPPGLGITLADDWRCSKSGPVEDIHFWGSWKDQDGVPSTDDYESTMPWFTLRIWSNDPGDPPSIPSHPDTMLWEWIGEIPGVPYEPPTLEGWYDPSVTEYLLVNNDHIPYWQYNFFLPAGTNPFIQEQGSIYWLSITAHLYSPASYQWGWKNSRVHFMDDAVWLDPTGMWQPIVEPPRYNIFDVWFDRFGVPADSGSTNYYGDGWYLYPSGWYNIWFYNNPFSTENFKNILLFIDTEEWGTNPRLTFALNYTTPLWSQEGEPGRPPLPEDFTTIPEDLYITRDSIDVVIGSPTTIPITIPAYNPEWVSIDIIATDLIVTGWIEHECVETSLDLAFVITGPEEDIPTLNEWGMLILALLLLAVGTIAVIRKRKAVPAEN